METHSLSKKVYSAIFWNLSGSLLKQGVMFLVSIFLSRLLSPADFGLVGMATVFIFLAQGFSDLGLTSGLIKEEHNTQRELSSVFYLLVFIHFNFITFLLLNLNLNQFDLIFKIINLILQL